MRYLQNSKITGSLFVTKVYHLAPSKSLILVAL